MREMHPEITLRSTPKGRFVTDGKDLFLQDSGLSIERAVDGQLAFAFIVQLERLHHEIVGALKATSEINIG
jgi:hypothetical protein